MVPVSASVGRGGVNRAEDVRKVQQLLRQAGVDPGPVDGITGPRTIGAILGFQQRFLTRPDGRVDPGRRTIARLNGPASRAAPRRPAPARPVAPARPAPAAPPARAVGGDWSGDSQSWSQDKKLASLQAGFRSKIVEVIRQLKAEGFRPTIVFGWRSVARQQELFRRGVTKVRFSFHNAQTPQGVPNAWAVDLVDER